MSPMMLPATRYARLGWSSQTETKDTEWPRLISAFTCQFSFTNTDVDGFVSQITKRLSLAPETSSYRSVKLLIALTKFTRSV